ncbi:MAG TPA: hypothetical protein VFV23_05945 [Verrucomicrobiae bacterium]|nr:hypothetical protein [Verrucomicrobiae bacterium]
MNNARAINIDNWNASVVNAKLTALVTTSKGNVQKVRITSKDLVKAISDDFGTNFKGDQIVYWNENDGYWLMDKHQNLVEDLSSDGVIEISHDDYYDNYSNNNHKYSETGVSYFYFASYGNDFDYGDSTIEFDYLYGSYTYNYTESSVFHGRYFWSETSKDYVGGAGYDGYISGDDIPVSGTIVTSGSGVFID